MRVRIAPPVCAALAQRQKQRVQNAYSLGSNPRGGIWMTRPFGRAPACRADALRALPVRTRRHPPSSREARSASRRGSYPRASRASTGSRNHVLRNCAISQTLASVAQRPERRPHKARLRVFDSRRRYHWNVAELGHRAPFGRERSRVQIPAFQPFCARSSTDEQLGPNESAGGSNPPGRCARAARPDVRRSSTSQVAGSIPAARSARVAQR